MEMIPLVEGLKPPATSPTGSPSPRGGDDCDGVREDAYMEMDTHVYSTGVMSVVKDVADLAKGEGRFFVKVGRLMVTSMVICVTIFLQVYCISCVKALVCAKSVHHIRETYSEYQESMYEGTIVNANGFSRGLAGTFKGIDAFRELDHTFKLEICQIPLSQPHFLAAILLIWSINCMAEVRRCVMWAYRFTWLTSTTTSAGSMYEKIDDVITVVALTRPVKAAIMILMSVQGATALYLLWVGCRWLLATPSFADLILNGLALTFIVDLKHMMYADLLPRMFQKTTEIVRVRREAIKMDLLTLLTPVGLLLLCSGWVAIYVYCLQNVLPEYRWDVRGVCLDFLQDVLKV